MTNLPLAPHLHPATTWVYILPGFFLWDIIVLRSDNDPSYSNPLTNAPWAHPNKKAGSDIDETKIVLLMRMTANKFIF